MLRREVREVRSSRTRQAALGREFQFAACESAIAHRVPAQNQTALAALTGALMFNGKLEEAMMVVRTRLELNPTDAYSNRDLAAVLYFFGRWEEAIKQTDIAQPLNPLDPFNARDCQVIAATSMIPIHRYGEAIERFGGLGDRPAGGGHVLLAAAEALRGNLTAARQHAAEILKIQPDFTIARHRSTRGSTEPAYLAGMDHFYAGLRLAGVPEGTAEGR